MYNFIYDCKEKCWLSLQDLINFCKSNNNFLLFSAIDEIVLSYMVSILEELGSEAAAEDAFDVEQFTEMMDAYIPGFAEMDW